jgi:nitric oxide reductase large subunit
LGINQLYTDAGDGDCGYARSPAFGNSDQTAMTIWLVVIVIVFAIIFAINPSIHSFLVVELLGERQGGG